MAVFEVNADAPGLIRLWRIYRGGYSGPLLGWVRADCRSQALVKAADRFRRVASAREMFAVEV